MRTLRPVSEPHAGNIDYYEAHLAATCISLGRIGRYIRNGVVELVYIVGRVAHMRFQILNSMSMTSQAEHWLVLTFCMTLARRAKRWQTFLFGAMPCI